MRELTECVEKDTVYQQLLNECAEAEVDYLALLETLTAEQRNVVERYLTACEELDHRKLYLMLC